MQNKTVSVPAAQLYKMIEGLLKFPYPQICRHLVAGEILDLLERNGETISNALAKAVVEADDFEAIKLLKEKL